MTIKQTYPYIEMIESAVQKLNKYEGYSNQILDVLSQVSAAEIPQDWFAESLTLTLNQLEQAATATAAKCKSPISIAVMGEFSSGKSVLLGSLIGYAGLLPDGVNETTGNIAAIHLVQQSELSQTEVSQAIVHYLYEAEVKDCLLYMLNEILVRFSQTDPARDVLAKLITLQQQVQQVQIDVLLKWCEQAWTLVQTKTRYLIQEIVTLLRTHQVHGIKLKGQSYTLDASMLEACLRFAKTGYSNNSILDLSFNQLLENIDQLIGKGEPLQLTPHPSSWDLQKTFYLIRRVDLTVEISQQVWDLSALKGTNDLVLLDCPGLGSERSSARDSFLALRELKQVQTIILVLDGEKPGNNAASEIRSKLEQDHQGTDLRDRILVVCGKFDLIKLEPEEQQKLTDLASNINDGEEISPQNLYEITSTLGRLLSSANNLTSNPNNIVLTSSMYALAKLKQNYPLLRVCTDKFLTKLDGSFQLAQTSMREIWGSMAAHLSQSPLQQQLRSYVQDGGIGRLRWLITEHVAEHGMKLLLQDTERISRQCRQKQLELEKILTEIPQYSAPVVDPNYELLREGIAELVSTYTEFGDKVQKLSTLTTSSGTDLLSVIENRAIEDIFEWEEWQFLLNNTKEGVITLSREKDITMDFDDIFLVLDKDSESIPTVSDDLYEPFIETLERLKSFALEQVNDAISYLVLDLSQQVKPISSKLRKFTEAESFQRVQQRGNSRHNILYQNFSTIIEFEKLAAGFKRISSTFDTSVFDDKAIFPLALKQETAQTSVGGQIFHWSPDKKYKSLLPFHHYVMFLRIRDEIITSTNLYFNAMISHLTSHIKLASHKLIARTVENLNEFSKREYKTLLEDMSLVDSNIEARIPAWLKTLSNISLTDYPD